MYDPNLINGAMPVQQAQVPPNFQQGAPTPSMGQGFSQNAMGMYQPDAATVTGLNQTLASAIKAANAPKSPWAQGQDISNNIFGNVIAPFAAGLGAPGAMDAAKTFKDQIDSDRKTRSDMLKSNIDQIKDITGSFDNLNRTQVAELGRKTAETNAQRMLQATQNTKDAAEARLKEAEHLHQLQDEHWKRMDTNSSKNADTKAATGAAIVEEKKTLTPAKAALMGQTATLRGAQAKEAPLTGQAKRDAMMGKTANDAKRTGIYQTAVDNRNTNTVETNRIRDKAADTGKQKADTQEKLAQNKIDNPKLGKYAAALAAIKGEPAPQTAQAGAKPGPLDHATALKFLQDAGGDKEKAREMARKAGHSF